MSTLKNTSSFDVFFIRQTYYFLILWRIQRKYFNVCHLFYWENILQPHPQKNILAPSPTAFSRGKILMSFFVVMLEKYTCYIARCLFDSMAIPKTKTIPLSDASFSWGEILVASMRL
jgi:hypothetical protein